MTFRFFDLPADIQEKISSMERHMSQLEAHQAAQAAQEEAQHVNSLAQQYLDIWGFVNDMQE